jgi:eukaryotic-like serine/threonine-protein kinase
VTPGSRLGPYEILAPLGAGGMGEVYRARDPRLGREVAVKVLPSSFSSDPDRLRRFEQEARAASALNHPNIVTIYDIGSSDSTFYIAMEFVDGSSLRDLMASGPLATKRMLGIGVQIAEGLAKAHSAGIVHRDLKPENVMVSKDGFAKLLDFGLAKLFVAPTEQASGMPTVIQDTQPGTVMGTVGYMSPEQASGKPVDFRSDQFSFGSILYEMATGKRAFQRDTGAETLTAIIKDEPEPVAQINPGAPAPFRWIVERCLAKDPEERYVSTADLARDLKSVRDHISETVVSGGVPSVEAPRRRGLSRVALGAALLAAGLLTGVLVGRRLMRTEPPSFHQLTFRRGGIESARFAPDGQTILYSARWEGKPVEIFVSRLDSPESRAFGLPGAELLSISPSGEMAVSLARRAFAFGGIGTLARLGMTGGGAPKEILEDVRSADWAPDGSRMAIVREVGGKSRLEFPAGKILYETAGWISHPRVSPRGDEIAFLDHPVGGDDGGSVAIVDGSGKRKTISGAFASIYGLCWSPGGREVWFTGASVGFNRALRAATRSGGVRVLAQGTGGLTIEDVSRDGRVLVVQDKARQEISALAPGAEKERNLSWLDWSGVIDLSSDGHTLLFDESGEGGGRGYSVYVRKTDGSPAIRLGEGGGAALSPDGRTALSILGSASSQAMMLYPIGTGEPKSLRAAGLRIRNAAWLPDGRHLLLFANEPDRGMRLWIQTISDGKRRAISPEGYSGFAPHAISPDGKFAAVTGPDQRFYLYPIEGGEPTAIPGLVGGIQFGWTADGRSIFIRRRGDAPFKISLVDVRSGRTEPWKELSPPDTAGITNAGWLAVTPDGKSYAYSYTRSLADLYVVEGLR